MRSPEAESFLQMWMNSITGLLIRIFVHNRKDELSALQKLSSVTLSGTEWRNQFQAPHVKVGDEFGGFEPPWIVHRVILVFDFVLILWAIFPTLDIKVGWV